MVRALAAALVVMAGAACGGGDDPDGTVLVFAASSLTEAFGDLEAAFEAAHPGVDVALNLAGSPTLREQILQGAPADVFASADRASMERVEEAGAIVGRSEVFARNRLQIVVPASNPGEVRGLQDFGDADLLVGLCAEGVPCGALAREVLERAGVEPSIDTAEPDVRSLRNRVAEGELDAGIVYVTDVLAAGDAVLGIDIPPEHGVEAVYPIAALTDGSQGPARAFVELVLSPQGQAILERHGFGAP